jgi:hypothetical protein
VKGRNIDINKVKTRTKVQHFISQAFKKNIAIWSCILLEMLMIMAQVFVDKFLSFGVVNNAP